MGKLLESTGTRKQAGFAILISDKTDFSIKPTEETEKDNFS